MTKNQQINAIDGLQCLWDFSEPANSPRVSSGANNYALLEGSGPIQRVNDGCLSGYSAELRRGDYFYIPRPDCPALALTKELSIVAWVKRYRKTEIQCEAIAGCWGESQLQRQYALFLDLRIHNSGDNVSGHVSREGGPTPGYRWSMDAAIGRHYVCYERWYCLAMTYDGQMARAYLDGNLDTRPGFNPYAYPGPLYDGARGGADFTVGGVHRHGEMGNWFVGRIGGLAVFSRALDPTTLTQLANLLPAQSAVPESSPP